MRKIRTNQERLVSLAMDLHNSYIEQMARSLPNLRDRLFAEKWTPATAKIAFDDHMFGNNSVTYKVLLNYFEL